jgi:hypothetical protein
MQHQNREGGTTIFEGGVIFALHKTKDVYTFCV